jgi:hypothetical protein
MTRHQSLQGDRPQQQQQQRGEGEGEDLLLAAKEAVKLEDRVLWDLEQV